MRKKGGVYSREAFTRGRAFIRSNTVCVYYSYLHVTECKKQVPDNYQAISTDILLI